ncbi:MAG: hypothetical protein ACREMV_15525 [Gemmatimonadales bacterium]
MLTHPWRRVIAGPAGPVVAALVLAGCYRYVPLAAPTPEPGARVQLELTDAGSAALAASVGPRVTLIEGELLAVHAETLDLGVVAVRFYDGQENYWKGERVAIPRGAIASSRQRRLSAPRTLLFAGAIVAAAASVGTATGALGGGSGGGGKPPPR